MSTIKSLLEMKKILILVLALAVYIVILVFVIVPLQGGLIPSSVIRSEDFQNADPQYRETLPIQTVDLSSSGRSIFIAVVMLSHVLYANLHLGGSWVAIVTASLYLKTKDKRYENLAKSLTLFNVILFSAGATFAIAGVLFFISLYPVFAAQLFHIYWWPFFVEAITFALEIFFLYSFWFTWGKINVKWHQFLGYGYAIDVFIQTFLINMVASGMLTPGGASIVYSQTGLMTIPISEAWAWWLNPTTLRLQLHRLAAAVSYFGFLVAMLGTLHYGDRKDEISKKHWDWVTSYGLAWGLLGLVFQPALGLIYMMAISDAQDSAFQMIMHGPRAWEMLLMVALFSALVISSLIYFYDRRERILTKVETRTWHTLFKICLIAAVICAIILVQPAWLGATFIDDPNAWENPLGSMDFKYPTLFTLIILGVIVLTIDTAILSDLHEAEWGHPSKTARTAAMLSGIFASWIVVVMGYVRESARSPWTIYNIIPVPHSYPDYPTPIPLPQIFVVWAVVIFLALTVFWYTSKVTAYHPEEAEKIIPRLTKKERKKIEEKFPPPLEAVEET